ncbi:hypothetical protein [Pseudoduganella aquatica]|uniref:Uncharacterized protein n=1 Tax=Pseudoduganella aquatica TaxID=2660641 RepID=A0A7X4HEP7_9BURK|nr:hypothetical protein [Pseudoduganella aquatica]MYN09017.1 hypothetical protein [Pseudoduganella aquatica]
MPAHTIIRDGSPYWWASTDIWVVPGTDPNGAPGTPVAGQPAYLWAHAANLGNTQANGTRIDFYWADPSAQVIVGNATAIGSAFADLAPEPDPNNPVGQDVLCLVPWVPVIVNGGHECLLAVAHVPGDTGPIPDPLPNGYVFDPPAHDQIAQRNITVLMAGMLQAAMVISVRALPRQDKEAFISVEYGGELDERQIALLGLRGLQLRPAPQRAVQVELSLQPLCGGKDRHPHGHEDAEAQGNEPGAAEDDMGAANGGAGPDADYGGKHGLRVRLPRGTATAVYAAFSADGLRPGQYQLVHIIERSQGKVAGGVSYVVVQLQGDKK